MAGLLLVALLVVGGWAVVGAGPGGGVASAGGPADELGPAPHVDLSSMSAREAADLLFNRVMDAVARDDTMEVERFLPMALGAHEIAMPLDVDGLFHLSLLQSTGGDFEAALATAEKALEREPEHLLALAAAAEAARRVGDDDRARARYERLVEAWDRERARDDRPEYEHHAAVLPGILEDAEAYLLETDR